MFLSLIKISYVCNHTKAIILFNDQKKLNFLPISALMMFSEQDWSLHASLYSSPASWVVFPLIQLGCNSGFFTSISPQWVSWKKWPCLTHLCIMRTKYRSGQIQGGHLVFENWVSENMERNGWMDGWMNALVSTWIKEWVTELTKGLKQLTSACHHFESRKHVHSNAWEKQKWSGGERMRLFHFCLTDSAVFQRTHPAWN